MLKVISRSAGRVAMDRLIRSRSRRVISLTSAPPEQEHSVEFRTAQSAPDFGVELYVAASEAVEFGNCAAVGLHYIIDQGVRSGIELAGISV